MPLPFLILVTRTGRIREISSLHACPTGKRIRIGNIRSFRPSKRWTAIDKNDFAK